MVNKEILMEGETYSNFRVLSQKELLEYRSLGIRLIHQETGTEVYHLYNNDSENLFAFTFRTPPYDNSGLPHILEHSVLSGSRRFPIKDPFVALLKGSMQTYLNAMTFPDKTVYPASSMNEKDFFNLMLVYGDAVFFPLLRKEIFQQEGYHLEFKELNSPESGLKIVGVVYSEMQGKYANPEALVADWSYQSLFPDTPYGFDSGGEPISILKLTYEAFVDFHKKYYHPSNCKIFLYGNIPTIKHLSFLEEEFLSQFHRLAIKSEIPYQPRWSSPRKVEVTFPIKREDSIEKKSSITINWLTVPVIDPARVIALEVLSEILVGNSGSPLRKALLDSKLGEDISPATGLETELKELVFTAGIRGTDPEQADKVEDIVLTTLKTIRDQGIDKETIDSALQRVEFRNREIKGEVEPYPLHLLRKTLRGWLHDTEPETTLKFNCWMEKLKKEISRKKNFFLELIEEQLLLNPHRSTLIVRPDPEHLKRQEAKLSCWLKKWESSLGSKGKEEIVVSAIKLKQFQEQPDPPEVINKIPFLKIEDLPHKVEIVPSEQVLLSEEIPLYLHDIFTNGIVYLDLSLDTEKIPEEDLNYLNLFGKAICNSGLPGIKYDEVARQLSLYTGGFNYQLFASGDLQNPLSGKKSNIFFRMKFLAKNLKPALELFRRLLIEADFDDQERMKDLIFELKNEFKAALLPQGHRFASLRAGSKLSPAIRLQEQWEGISQVFFSSELAKEIEKKIKNITSALKKLRQSLVNRAKLAINITAEESVLKGVKDALLSLIEDLPKENSLDARLNLSEEADVSSLRAESFIIPSPVGYIAHALYGAWLNTPENGYEAVLSHFLRTGYLWEKVRMRGGAYGVYAVSQGAEGVFIFSSYRDPNVLETLKAFRDSLDYAAQGKIDEDQIEKAIIGTVAKDEKPLDPGEKGFISFKRKLYGVTDELRQRRREFILEVNREKLVRVAENLIKNFDCGFKVVISNEKAIAAASEILPELKERSKIIPV